MDVEEAELETHFVENPFIRVRERANKKQLDSKGMMTAEQIEEDAMKADIVMLSADGKFRINDLEQMEVDQANEKRLKRKRAEIVGYGQGENVDSDLEEGDTGTKKAQDQKKQLVNKFKAANPVVTKKRDLKAEGHTVKASADRYKSSKGKGDVLKQGAHEPYAYIKLNPEMLNPKKKA